MNKSSEIRNNLHNWIDELPDEDLPLVSSVLEAESGFSSKLSPDQLKELQQRRERFLRGEGKNYTPAEAMSVIRGRKA